MLYKTHRILILGIAFAPVVTEVSIKHNFLIAKSELVIDKIKTEILCDYLFYFIFLNKRLVFVYAQGACFLFANIWKEEASLFCVLNNDVDATKLDYSEY